MTLSLPHRAALACHSAAPCRWVRHIHVQMSQGSGALALSFSITGDLDHLRIPAPRPRRRADRLWQHTCFEVFVAPEDGTAYYEFNFAPSGEWAAYAFRRYRDGEPLAPELDPEITVRSAGDRLELDTVVRRDWLPLAPPGTRTRLGLSAVVEDDEGNLSYWALRHPPGKPDFHHPDAFALTLAPTDADSMAGPVQEENR